MSFFASFLAWWMTFFGAVADEACPPLQKATTSCAAQTQAPDTASGRLFSDRTAKRGTQSFNDISNGF
jgi:hypothetical protein